MDAAFSMLLTNDANYQRLDGDGLARSGAREIRFWKIAFMSSFTVMTLESITLLYAVNMPSVPRPTSPVPKFPRELRTFLDDDKWHNITKLDEVNKIWEPFLPPGKGFVHVASPERFHLPPNRNVATSDNAYILSVYHQLHCLQNLHKMHVQLAGTIESRTSIDAEHAEHCFIYLRDAILCSADTTLEPPDEPKLRKSGNPLHGWGVQHMCTVRVALADWTRRNSAF